MTDKILSENRRRKEKLEQEWRLYDPLTGQGSLTDRTEVKMWGKTLMRLPTEMTKRKEFNRQMSKSKLEHMRLKYDFEYWCISCVKIRHKQNGEQVAFRLNRPQRKVAAILERMRIEGKPIRMILLKARQWGGSTLIQMYYAWIQIMLKDGWNSLICAHVKDTAATIREMYREMLENYPRNLWKTKDEPELKRCRGGECQVRISGRRNKIAIGSSMAPNSLRGHDSSLAHLSEVAFWSDTPKRKPLSFLRTVCGTIANEPLTAIILESTANGTGNYFHQAWKEAESGMSAYAPVFVAWHETEIYSSPATEKELTAIAKGMSEYEQKLWDNGVTLEQIKWYREKSSEYPDLIAMKAEFPSNATEAFLNTGRGVFSHEAIEKLREGCCRESQTYTLSGNALTGPRALDELRLREDPQGKLKVWSHPTRSHGTRRSRYVVTVDIGGRSEGSDWSVIAVIDRHGNNGKPETAAQWRGHADHDIVAWQAAQIATWYDSGLLVIESNSLESGDDASLYVLNALRRSYKNMYVRQAMERCDAGLESKPGFHTNRRTKQAAITELIAAVRDGGYTERDPMACDEMSVYEEKPNGSYAAKDGKHDDILMTRAIGLYVIAEMGDTQTATDEEETDIPWW